MCTEIKMREVLELVKLIGILLVAVGFLFRLNTLLVVMVAGIVTGWFQD